DHDRFAHPSPGGWTDQPGNLVEQPDLVVKREEALRASEKSHGLVAILVARALDRAFEVDAPMSLAAEAVRLLAVLTVDLESRVDHAGFEGGQKRQRLHRRARRNVGLRRDGAMHAAALTNVRSDGREESFRLLVPVTLLDRELVPFFLEAGELGDG